MNVRSILLPTDFSECARKAVPYAIAAVLVAACAEKSGSKAIGLASSSALLLPLVLAEPILS